MEFKKWNINDTPEITIPEMNENLDLIQEELRKAQVVKQLDNLFVNGDFSNGLTGWVRVASNIVAVNNTLINTADGSGPVAYCEITVPNVIGNKVYIRARARVTNPNCVSLSFNRPVSVYSPIVSNPVENQWYTLSTVGDATHSISRFVHQYQNASIASGKVMEVQYVSVINLTQVFGAGNEPSKEFCDSIMEVVGWFDGQYDLTIQEMFIIIAKWSQAQNVNQIMTLPNFDETE